MRFTKNPTRLQLENIWLNHGCYDALRIMHWKVVGNGAVMSNQRHYKVAKIKVKGSLATAKRKSEK